MSEVETEERVRREIAIRVAIRRRLDLDHARTEIRQQGGGVGTGNERRTFDHSEIFK